MKTEDDILIVAPEGRYWGLPDNIAGRLAVSECPAWGQSRAKQPSKIFFILDSAADFGFTKLAETASNFPEASIYLLGETIFEPIMQRVSDKGVCSGYYILPLTESEFSQILENGKLDSVESNSYEARIRKLSTIAYCDELTGLRRRRFFTEAGNQILRLSECCEIAVSVFLFDIDDFKKYNDQYGHLAGDQIIKDTSNALRNSFRPHDLLARIGGDEFAVMIWDFEIKNESIETGGDERRHYYKHPVKSSEISRRISENVVEVETSRGRLTLSGGMASFPEGGSDLHKLLESADNALMKAKKSGKHTILFS
ncbi:GGDEF domain-containing protein [Sedimentisphaera salicampi]|uniref:diguanylate cyclase n=1 Tax=Sedimentisphaera salicampi TaxID=1941349 RepID=A0A1W6LP14_9BACT|nr:GGDEF domain-containing protein [Sedimentisphaera salicampi]ARN57507.1 putative diguanylate cyclase YcdT [Sedimentisphaera salicampi]OXU14370.1 putative diguanylate cyclase YcdT [Sedimentisphaera salicampi]